MKKIYRGLVNSGALSAIYAVTEASSSAEAIETIKDAGYRFHISDAVSEDGNLRSYIKGKVESGDYVWVGDYPLWW
jgi:hypothetical protein